MKFTFLTELTSGDVPVRIYDRAFAGNPLDDRGRYSDNLIKTYSSNVHKATYKFEKYELEVDMCLWRANEMDKLAQSMPASSVLFDATTLNFPELLLLMRGYLLVKPEIEFGFIYAEPEIYRGIADIDNNPHAFMLSESVESKLQPIPGFSPLLRPSYMQSHVVVFLGFEGHRLTSLLADSEAELVRRYSIVFGIPPFKAQWETHSLMENADILSKSEIEDIYYAGANNPRSNYNLIVQLFNTLSTSSILELAPLGTKPATIACALFAASHRGVGVRFDYPKQLPNRTQGIGRVHLFRVNAEMLA